MPHAADIRNILIDKGLRLIGASTKLAAVGIQKKEIDDAGQACQLAPALAQLRQVALPIPGRQPLQGAIHLSDRQIQRFTRLS